MNFSLFIIKLQCIFSLWQTFCQSILVELLQTILPVSFKGKVGKDFTKEEGYEAAKSTGIGCIARLKGQVGDLDKVKRIVKLLTMVNCTPDFTDQPAVANGCSDLMVEVFGDKGKHARSAVGMGSLPGNIPVEIEMIVEIED